MAAGGSMEIDENLMRERDSEIEKIIQIAKALRDELTAGLIDLDISDEISGFLMTVFTCLRKEENVGHKRFLEYIAKIKGIEVTVKGIYEKIKANNIKLDFLVATPIVEILTLFKAFYDEVRTGVTRFRVRESVARKGVKRDRDGKMLVVTKQQESTQNISQYGLSNQHIPLLQGITLAPERRTGILRSIGPLAQAILLVMEDKYFEKLKAALNNSLQMFPMSIEIIVALKDATHLENVSGVLKELGDILLLTTARSTQKMYVPLLLFMLMWKKGNVLWSFSGTAALQFYTDFVQTYTIRLKMRSGSDGLKTAEVAFHAMFGTYLENLKVLEQITNRPKYKKGVVNPVFLKRGEKAQVTFNPIIFKYVSKMAQALLTKSLGNIDPMSIARPSFNGFRNRHFTQELTYISTGKSALNFTSEPTQLQYALKKLKDDLMNEKDKLIKGGTSKWVRT